MDLKKDSLKTLGTVYEEASKRFGENNVEQIARDGLLKMLNKIKKSEEEA